MLVSFGRISGSADDRLLEGIQCSTLQCSIEVWTQLAKLNWQRSLSSIVLCCFFVLFCFVTALERRCFLLRARRCWCCRPIGGSLFEGAENALWLQWGETIGAQAGLWRHGPLPADIAGHGQNYRITAPAELQPSNGPGPQGSPSLSALLQRHLWCCLFPGSVSVCT